MMSAIDDTNARAGQKAPRDRRVAQNQTYRTRDQGCPRAIRRARRDRRVRAGGVTASAEIRTNQSHTPPPRMLTGCGQVTPASIHDDSLREVIDNRETIARAGTFS